MARELTGEPMHELNDGHKCVVVVQSPLKWVNGARGTVAGLWLPRCTLARECNGHTNGTIVGMHGNRVRCLDACGMEAFPVLIRWQCGIGCPRLTGQVLRKPDAVCMHRIERELGRCGGVRQDAYSLKG